MPDKTVKELLIETFNPELNEFDKLENDLLLVPDIDSVLKYLGKWILAKLNPQFLAFTFLNKNKIHTVKYYSEQTSSNKVFFEMLNERKLNKSEFAVILHSCGGFSVPFVKKGKISGYIFIGTRNNKKDYTQDDIHLLVPLARILGKSLLFQEALLFRKEKKQLQSAFSKYVSPDVVDQIMFDSGSIHLGGEKQILSVIFTDLEGFTTMSDGMDPVQLVRVLNMYLNEMSEVIIALGGTIDKFEGDAIMAFFGAPSKLEDHAVRCCRAALRMQKMERILNIQLLNENLITKPLHTRMGVNSGDMVVGNVGSLKRLDYTIIGSNVNIAARIENVNKEFGTSILISDQTYELVKDYFNITKKDTVHLRGVKRPITVYELISEKENCPSVIPRMQEKQEIEEPTELEEI